MSETSSKALNREQIENLIKENKSLAGLNMEQAELEDIHFVGADLRGTSLKRANLRGAHLFNADLRGASLFKANLEGANLNNADLRDCDMLGAVFDGARMAMVRLNPDCIVINEKEAHQAREQGDREQMHLKYGEARDVYRSLKRALMDQVPSSIVGVHFVREMTMERKLLPLISLQRAWLKFIEMSMGYGERIERILSSILMIIGVSALGYGIEGVRYGETIVQFGSEAGFFSTLGNLIYFSVVVFTTVGFGDIVPVGPISKFIVIFEGLSSTIYMAILIIALYKHSMAR